MAAPAKYVIPGAIAEESSDCEESHDDVGFALPMASSSPRQGHHPRQRPSMYAFSYRTMFLACLASNEPEKAVDIVTIAHGAEWNFLYQETGLSPLCAVVDPAASELDPRAMHAVVDALVAHGARLDWPPSSPSLQASRFHIAFVAASYGIRDVVELVLDLGYPVNATSPVPVDDTAPNLFATLAHAAASSGSIQCIELLLHRGADFTAADGYGRTPLHTMLYTAPDDSIGDVLLQCGNDAFQVDHLGNSAFAMAVAVCPDLARSMLTARSVYQKQAGSGAIWKHDFRRLFVDETAQPLTFRVFGEATSRTGAAVQPVPSASAVVTPPGQRLSALALILRHDQKDLLSTPIVKSYLHEGWCVVARRIWVTEVVEYTVFVLSFLAQCHTWPTVADLAAGAALQWYSYVLYFLILLLSARSNSRTARTVLVLGLRTWIRSIWNVAALLLQSSLAFILIAQLVVICGWASAWTAYWVNATAVVQVLFGVRFLRFACVPKMTGALVAMVVIMLDDVARFFAFFLAFYVPFTNAYNYLLFRENVTIEYHNVAMLLFRWIFGGADYSIFKDNLAPGNVDMAQSMFILYLVTVVIVLINILAALLTNTFNAVVESSDLEYMKAFASAFLELSCLAPRTSIGLFHRHLLDSNLKPIFADKPSAGESNWARLVKSRLDRMLSQQSELASSVKQLRMRGHAQGSRTPSLDKSSTVI
ncbi:Ankyrin repeat domain-containing protein [Plasmodiophora brassicae]